VEIRRGLGVGPASQWGAVGGLVLVAEPATQKFVNQSVLMVRMRDRLSKMHAVAEVSKSRSQLACHGLGHERGCRLRNCLRESRRVLDLAAR
jgi:hypothetical protein